MPAPNYRPSAATEAARMQKELDALLERARAAADREVQADLIRYLCIRLSGFLEQMCLLVGRSTVERLSSSHAQRFGLSFLRSAVNPEPSRLEEWVSRFDSDAKRRLCDFLAQEERRSRLSALVAMRNQLAHGVHVGMGIQSILEYRTLCDEVVSFLISEFEPPVRRA